MLFYNAKISKNLNKKNYETKQTIGYNWEGQINKLNHVVNCDVDAKWIKYN